jgi:hypothetical protein
MHASYGVDFGARVCATSSCIQKPIERRAAGLVALKERTKRKAVSRAPTPRLTDQPSAGSLVISSPVV